MTIWYYKLVLVGFHIFLSVSGFMCCTTCKLVTHQFLILKLKSSVKEPNKFHNYETEKITRKASDAAEYIELFRVRFFHPRSSCTTYLMLFSERPPIYMSSSTASIWKIVLSLYLSQKSSDFNEIWCG